MEIEVTNIRNSIVFHEDFHYRLGYPIDDLEYVCVWAATDDGFRIHNWVIAYNSKPVV